MVSVSAQFSPYAGINHVEFVPAGGFTGTDYTNGRVSFTFAQPVAYDQLTANGQVTVGMQQPYLEIISDTLLEWFHNMPVAYHQSIIDACGSDTLYYYPQDNHGMDSLFMLTTYVVTHKAADIDTTLHYNICDVALDYPDADICEEPNAVVRTTTYPHNYAYAAGEPAEYTNVFTYSIAGKTLDTAQSITVRFPICGGNFLAEDYENNQYSTVRIGCACWTAENLRSLLYGDGTPVEVALVYTSPRHPDPAANEAQYGRLYSWYSAVNIPEGSSADPMVNADSIGQLQGVCPNGWHLASMTEYEQAIAFANGFGNASDVLRSESLWTQNNGTDDLDFTVYPAGRYNSALDRYENLTGNAYFWSVDDNGDSQIAEFNYYCEPTMGIDMDNNFGASIRCVKNN